MAANVQPIIEPDAEQMRRHLEHLFGGELDGCHDGLIEISWTHHQPDSGGRYPLRHARLFRTDEIDEAVEEASKQNRIPNQNVYVGAALRKPDTPPFGRATDEDFFALTAFYADLDDEASAQTAKGKYEHCRPTLVVVTGRHPYTRAQLWWRQEVPERDPRAARAQNEALAAALAGDPVVVNPSRVMRLAGTVAWPTKPGRQLERTDLVEFSDGRPAMYVQGTVQRAFSAAPLLAAPSVALTTTSPTATPSFDPATGEIIEVQPKPNFDVGRLSVDGVVEAIVSGREWHNNVIRLVAHWCGRGWTDTEIMLAASSLTLPGWTVAQTRAEVGKAIDGARRKYQIPNPSAEVEAPQDASTLCLDVATWLARDIPAPDFLMGEWLSTTSRVMLVAPTGLGKTNFSMALAFATAAAQPFLHWRPHRPSRVLYIDGEMSRRLLKMRLADASRRLGMAPATLFALCRDDVESMPPLNTPAGQAFIGSAIDHIGGVDLIVFDNVMSLLSGDMKEEDGWGATLPWVKDLTRRSIGQIWVHHTGHDESHSYGTSTREWQLDTVMLLKRRTETNADIAFTLEFTKARERTPNNRNDFETTDITLLNDQWTSARNEHEDAPRIRLTPKEQRAVEVLKNVFVDHGRQAPQDPKIPNVLVVSMAQFRAALRNEGITDITDPKIERAQWWRIKEALDVKGIIRTKGDFLWFA